MYITRNIETDKGQDFDWDSYFRHRAEGDRQFDGTAGMVLGETRRHLKEDQALFGFIFHRMMKALMSRCPLQKHSRILELGAATGFLSRWLCEQYEGTATLVDRSAAAYEEFLRHQSDLPERFEYIREDLFRLNLTGLYDIVCSFGVIEHFESKKALLDVHRKFVRPDGYLLILIPLDSPLTRAFYEVNFELNQGYRELLTENELLKILRAEGLEIVHTTRSYGYVYDIAAALCKVADDN